MDRQGKPPRHQEAMTYIVFFLLFAVMVIHLHSAINLNVLSTIIMYNAIFHQYSIQLPWPRMRPWSPPLVGAVVDRWLADGMVPLRALILALFRLR
jgi:hypothetical protein